EGFADEFFVGERAVDFGGVEKGDATFDGGANERDAVLLGNCGTEAETEAHAAEPKGGDFEVTFAENALLHDFSSDVLFGLVWMRRPLFRPWPSIGNCRVGMSPYVEVGGSAARVHGLPALQISSA